MNDEIYIKNSDIQLKDLVGTVLFENDNGQVPDITLNDNPLKYKRIEVYASTKDYLNYGVFSTTVFPKITKIGIIFIAEAGAYWGRYLTFRFEITESQLKQKTVSCFGGDNGSINKWWTTDIEFKVLKVIGYKY